MSFNKENILSKQSSWSDSFIKSISENGMYKLNHEENNRPFGKGIKSIVLMKA
jgi:hypothetical protein